MSVEHHPNIQAVALTVDIMESFIRNLRGNAVNDKPKALHIMAQKVTKFVAELSTELDKEFGE